MKIPPHSLEAEQAILGACLSFPETVAFSLARISSDDFYDNRHKIIFSAVAHLANTGRNIDPITVVEQIGAKIQTAGGVSYIASLQDVAIGPSFARQHCMIVKEKAQARKAIALAASVQEACFRGDSIKGILDDFSTGFISIAGKDKGHPETLAQITPRTVEGLKKASLSGVPFGISTGFIDLDRRLAGLAKKDLVVIAARPSMGKTVLGVDIGINVAAQGKHVLMFSLEMSKEQIVTRILSNKASVSGDTLRHGGLNDYSLPKIDHAARLISSLPVTIIDDPGLSISEIRAMAKTQHIQNKLGMVLVDYMQLSNAKAQSREREISEISSGLKGMAKELDLPVVALSQLNRSLEGRTDKRPMLSDLRESGSIEQDSDVVMFIYRDEVYNKDANNPNKGIAEIITAKQRNGPTGIDRLLFQGEFSRFVNYDYQRDGE